MSEASKILAYRGPVPDALTVAVQEHERAIMRTNKEAHLGGHAAGLGLMLRGWAEYADAHRRQCESGIGDDGVLGPQWESIGRALLGLLNGDRGGFDGASLDRNIRDALEREGFPMR